jgi:gluconate kinase
MTERDVPLLVVVAGPPASGKTTIARTLSRELRLPLVAKDDLKEMLFDALGTGDREWSRSLGRATFGLMFHLLREQLGAGCSVIAEANFRTFEPMPPHRALQIYCTAPREVLLERYARRARHPGHLDGELLAELRGGLLDDYVPLPLDGELIEIDTGGEVDLESLLAEVRAAV